MRTEGEGGGCMSFVQRVCNYAQVTKGAATPSVTGHARLFIAERPGHVAGCPNLNLCASMQIGQMVLLRLILRVKLEKRNDELRILLTEED